VRKACGPILTPMLTGCSRLRTDRRRPVEQLVTGVAVRDSAAGTEHGYTSRDLRPEEEVE
jgi:hypothetical protein